MDVRPGEKRDLEQVNEIYNHYVLTSPCTFDIDPITMEQRRGWFEAFGGRNRFIAATEADDVLGWAHSGPFRDRRAYETSVATTVYVHQDHHGKGVGSALYRALFVAIAEEDVHRAYAGITVPNAGSFALHQTFGFKQVAYFTEQGRKFGTYWDVAWFEKEL
jgi:phosphinothricin acetyltransferase